MKQSNHCKGLNQVFSFILATIPPFLVYKCYYVQQEKKQHHSKQQNRYDLGQLFVAQMFHLLHKHVVDDHLESLGHLIGTHLLLVRTHSTETLRQILAEIPGLHIAVGMLVNVTEHIDATIPFDHVQLETVETIVPDGAEILAIVGVFVVVRCKPIGEEKRENNARMEWLIQFGISI